MISLYLPVFPWQRQMRNQNFKHVFMHNDVTSLYGEQKLYDNKEFKIFRHFEAKYWPYRPWSFKIDLKLRAENLAYENGHLEITEIKSISCILKMTLKSPYVCLRKKLAFV